MLRIYADLPKTLILNFWLWKLQNNFPSKGRRNILCPAVWADDQINKQAVSYSKCPFRYITVQFQRLDLCIRDHTSQIEQTY